MDQPDSQERPTPLASHRCGRLHLRVHFTMHVTQQLEWPCQQNLVCSLSDSSVKELENQHYTLPAATDTIQQAVTNLNFEVSLEAMKGAPDRKIRNQPLGTGIRTRSQTQPQHIFKDDCWDSGMNVQRRHRSHLSCWILNEVDHPSELPSVQQPLPGFLHMAGALMSTHWVTSGTCTHTRMRPATGQCHLQSRGWQRTRELQQQIFSLEPEY